MRQLPERVPIHSTLGLIIKKNCIMNRYGILASAFALALGLVSCAQLEEFEQDVLVPEAGEKIKLILNAERGESVKSADTRVYVGSTSGGKVTYYWSDNDQIGVVPLNLSTINNVKPNYHSYEKEIHSNRNYATFNAYITSDGFDTSKNPHLFIYYPYNDSMLEGNTGTTGSSFIGSKQGLTFRLPQLQDQYKYSRTLGASEHPSAWALSQYGLAYDLAGCQTSTEGNDVTSTGEFTLDHANSYFQFNVYGTQSQGSDNNYGDGTWRLASVAMEAGHCELGTDEEGNTVYTLNDQVELAGTYKITYNYSSTHFNDVSGKTNNDKVTVTNVIPQKSVKVTMRDAATSDGAILGGTKATGAPAFATINGLGIKNNVKGNLNCMKVSVTAYRYDENGNVTNSDTRVRFYNIESIAGKDISGNYYTIDFEFCDPVESYTDLSLEGPANCYVIGAPGNYTFSIDVAGNGKAAHGGFKANISDPSNLIDTDNPENLGFTWLWASGLSFEKYDDGTLSDTEIVRKVLNSEEIAGEDGRVSIGLATGSTEQLSGNIVLALYKINTDGTAGDIVWTWHLWLGQPQQHHFRFSATSDGYQFTNEEWYMLDRNIGAESSELGNPRSTGLFYQRGRINPIIGFADKQGSTQWQNNQLKSYSNVEVFGSDVANWKAGQSYNNDISVPIRYPMALIDGISYTNASDYYYAWNAAQTVTETSIANDTKSMFDPCPPGYRLPTTREWDNFKNVEFTDVTANELASGVFGYCFLKELENVLNTSNTTDAIIAERIANGNYYTVNDQYERTYYIKDHSATGNQQIVKFPNSGVLYSDGELKYLYQQENKNPIVSHTIPAGPEVDVTVSERASTINAPQLTGSLSYSSRGYFTLSGVSGTLYYSVGVDNPATTASLTSNYRIYPTSGSTSGRIYLNLSSSKTQEKVYLYYKDSNGNVSNPTIVTVNRQSSNNRTTYTATYTNGSSTSMNVNVTFKSGTGTYYYSIDNGTTKTTLNNASLPVNCSSLSYSNVGGTDQAKLYVYGARVNVSGTYYYPQTAITIQRSGTSASYSYSVANITIDPEKTIQTGGEVTGVISEAALAMWSSGRVNGTKYEFFWFGPMRDRLDPWKSGSTPSYKGSETRKHFDMGYAPYGLWGVQDVPGIGEGDNNNGAKGAATVARCIREYDNTSIVVVAE